MSFKIKTSNNFGATRSGNLSNVLFCDPGVPPMEFAAAIKLALPIQSVKG